MEAEGSREVNNISTQIRTIHTNQYYEACFIGYFTIFKEIAYNLLDFPAES